jgi:hypothetical protein
MVYFLFLLFYNVGCWYSQKACSNYWYFCRSSPQKPILGRSASQRAEAEDIQGQVGRLPKTCTQGQGNANCGYMLLIYDLFLNFGTVIADKFEKEKVVHYS